MRFKWHILFIDKPHCAERSLFPITLCFPLNLCHSQSLLLQLESFLCWTMSWSPWERLLLFMDRLLRCQKPWWFSLRGTVCQAFTNTCFSKNVLANYCLLGRTVFWCLHWNPRGVASDGTHNFSSRYHHTWDKFGHLGELVWVFRINRAEQVEYFQLGFLVL